MSRNVTVTWRPAGDQAKYRYRFASDVEWPASGQPTVEMYDRIAESEDVLPGNVEILSMWLVVDGITATTPEPWLSLADSQEAQRVLNLVGIGNLADSALEAMGHLSAFLRENYTPDDGGDLLRHAVLVEAQLQAIRHRAHV